MDFFYKTPGLTGISRLFLSFVIRKEVDRIDRLRSLLPESVHNNGSDKTETKVFADHRKIEAFGKRVKFAKRQRPKVSRRKLQFIDCERPSVQEVEPSFPVSAVASFGVGASGKKSESFFGSGRLF